MAMLKVDRGMNRYSIFRLVDLYPPGNETEAIPIGGLNATVLKWTALTVTRSGQGVPFSRRPCHDYCDAMPKRACLENQGLFGRQGRPMSGL